MIPIKKEDTERELLKSIKTEAIKTNYLLSEIDKRQKKDNRVGLFVTVSVFAGTIYATAYLEIIDKERLKYLLNFAYDSLTGVTL